jgi:hypothetical protein
MKPKEHRIKTLEGMINYHSKRVEHHTKKIEELKLKIKEEK